MKIKSYILCAILITNFQQLWALSWSSADLDGANGTADLDLTSLAYGNGIFLAGGAPLSPEAFAYRSTDGTNWSAIDGITKVNKFRYVNDEFWLMANVNDGEGLFKSSDGITWNPVTLPDTDAFNFASYNDIIYGDGTYVMVGRYLIAHSADGENWMMVEGNFPYNITWVDWAGDRFYAGSPGPANGGAPLLTSTDGITWTEVTDTTFEALRTFGAAFGNDIYGVGANFPGFSIIPAYSTDGETWSRSHNLNEPSPRDFMFAGGYFFTLGGGSVSSSTDMQDFAEEPISDAVGVDSFSAVAGVYDGESIYVLVDKGDNEYALASAEVGSSPSAPYLTIGADDFGGGWYFNAWLGSFNTSSWPWVYSYTFGWLYAGVDGNSLQGSWFYMTDPQLNDWFWMSEGSPNLIFGQPTGQTSQWWFIEFGEAADSFILFGNDGSTVISD